MDFNVAPAAKDHPRRRKRRKKTKWEEKSCQSYSRKTRRNKQGERREDLIIRF